MSQIAGYNTTIAGLSTGKKGAEVSLSAANKVLNGFNNSLSSSRKKLEKLPDWTRDPTIIALRAEKTSTETAIAVANEILKGSQAVVNWAHVDLDPRVAPFVALKETAELSLAAAYEAVGLLGDVVENFNPELHPEGKYIILLLQ